MSGTQSADPGENDPNRRMYADSQTASSADFARLEWRLSIMRDRIDVLQMQAKHPLKQASNWIAILALLVSLGTASASYVQTREKNIQDARSELKDFSQRSLEISRELRELVARR